MQGASYFLMGLALCLSVTTKSTAQSPELDRARATFAEALADQQAGHADAALEKFRRVAEVRDTPQVEYRIGTCLEVLGKHRAALVAYDRSARLGRGDAQAEDVVTSANEHIATLAASMGKLAISVHGADSPEVHIDGDPIGEGELRGAVVLEPGNHVVDVTAAGKKPAHTSVTIERAIRVDLSVDLVPDTSAVHGGVPQLPPSYTRRSVGIVMLGAAGALGIGAGLTLFVRQNTIDTIKTDCPSQSGLNVCPITLHDQIESMRATASALGPVAITLGGFAIAAAAVGSVLLALGPTRATTVGITPTATGIAVHLGLAF